MTGALVVTPADIKWCLSVLPDKKARIDELKDGGKIVIVEEKVGGHNGESSN